MNTNEEVFDDEMHSCRICGEEYADKDGYAVTRFDSDGCESEQVYCSKECAVKGEDEEFADLIEKQG